MRSGNSPLAFKLMGSSPVKQTKDEKTGKKEPTVEMPTLPVEKLKVDLQTDPKPRPANSGQAYSDKEVMSDDYNYPTSDNSGDQSEVKEKEKKDGWKFDIDWNEVATNAVGAVVTTGIRAALGGESKKVIRKGGSISGFADQKFSSGTNLFAKKSDSV